MSPAIDDMADIEPSAPPQSMLEHLRGVVGTFDYALHCDGPMRFTALAVLKERLAAARTSGDYHDLPCPAVFWIAALGVFETWAGASPEVRDGLDNVAAAMSDALLRYSTGSISRPRRGRVS